MIIELASEKIGLVFISSGTSVMQFGEKMYDSYTLESVMCLKDQ